MKSRLCRKTLLTSLCLIALALPAICGATQNFTVGVWRNVEPAAFHSPGNMQTIAVAVNPVDASVFAAASNKTNGGNGSTGIYKSTDCGSTWTLWSTGAGSSNLATGQLWAMLIDPVSPNNMYVANGYGDNNTLFKSTDGGVNWFPLNPDASHVLSMQFVQAVAIDPANSRHIAVTFHVNGTAPFNSNILSKSTDGGATWTEFNGPSAVNGWQEGATLTILGPTAYFYGCGQGAYYTSDNGQSWTKVISQGIFGRYAGSTELSPNGTLYIGVTNTGLFQSRANTTSSPAVPLGAAWTQIPNSQFFTNMIDDGVNMYGATVDGPPFWTASLSTPTVWTHMSSPGITSGSNQMAYDPINHIIYSANFQSGLLALQTIAATSAQCGIASGKSMPASAVRATVQVSNGSFMVRKAGETDRRARFFDVKGRMAVRGL